MPGIQDFTRFNVGKETVRGTPVAPTRKLDVEGTGTFEPDPVLNLHEGSNRGRRSEVSRITSMQEDCRVRLRMPNGIGWDDNVVPLSFLNGTATGTGAGADKTWAFTPSMTGTNSPPSYSADAGDDTQNWRLQYLMLTRMKWSSGVGQVTTFESDGFAQRAVKTTAAAPADNTTAKIAGDLWTVKFATTFGGLGAASVQTNLLLSWALEIRTGLVWRHYQDGNLFGAQHVETSIGVTFSATVESTAFAVSEFYDKYMSQTVDYMRLRATGPALGGSNYQLTFDVPIVWTKVPPISAQDEGINLFDIEGRGWDDLTNPVVTPTLVGSLTALP